MAVGAAWSGMLGMFVISLLAPDNVRNILLNGKLFGDTIQNYSVHGYRRVELVAQSI